MNSLDDLMAVWRAQDAAPLHGVNETLLGLALRQDEAKLRKKRRMEEWVTYLASVGIVAGMGFFLWIMAMNFGQNVVTVWDFAVPLAGMAAALVWASALYVRRRTQSRLEQRFGGSLREQLSLHIAQLDSQISEPMQLANILAATLPPFVCVTAILVAGMRVNAEPNDPFEGWVITVGMIGIAAYSAWDSVRTRRRQVEKDLLPRRRHLETLLKELEE